MSQPDLLYHLSPKSLRRIAVQRKTWGQPQNLNLETVEISPQLCCFEWKGSREFNFQENLEIHLYLREGTITKKASVVACDPCQLLDDNYDRQIWFTYRARFEGELEEDFFRHITGAPRRCRSFLL